MRRHLEFAAHGTPAPQGSKNARSFCGQEAAVCKNCHRRHVVKINLEEASSRKLKEWRSAVKAAAALALVEDRSAWPLAGPVMLTVAFFMPRPKSHFRTGRFSHLLRDDAPRWPVYPPDLSKLVRATEDALTEVGVWKDDSQVVEYGQGTKMAYASGGELPGAFIAVAEL